MTHEEAIKILRDAHDNALFSVRTALETIISELREDQENNVIDIPFGAHDSELKGWEYTIPKGFTAEIKDGKVIVKEKVSEDEKIRKALVEYHRQQFEKNMDQEIGLFHKDALTYLEKQKERSADINKTSASDDERIMKWIKKEIEHKYVVEGIVNSKQADDALGWLERQKYLYETTKDRFYREGFEEGQLYEKQKEQKPAEPVEKLTEEEYVKKFKALCNAYEIKLPNREYDIYHLCEDLHKLFGDIQKPAEWSEDDSTKIGTLSGIIFDYAFYKDALDENNDLTGEYAELDNWLGYLPERFNLQPKQEWSEDERKILDSIIDDYEAASKSFCGYDGKIWFLKAIRDGEYNLPNPLGARRTRNVDEFSLTLRNCLSTDSELTKEQADTFARAYGEDLYKVALGEMKTGLDRYDIAEYKEAAKEDEYK